MKNDKLFLGFLLLFGVVILSLGACASKKQGRTKSLSVITEALKELPSKQSEESWLRHEDGSASSGRYLSSTYVKTRLFLEKISKNFSSWHPYITPFPVVLLVLAPWFFVLNWIKYRLEFSWMVRFCLWGGFLSSLLAMLSGYPASPQVSLTQTQHAIAGEFVFWMTGLCIGIRHFTRRWETKLWIRIPIGLLLFLISFMVLFSVHLSRTF